MIQVSNSAVSGKGTSESFETSRSGKTGFFSCHELLCRHFFVVVPSWQRLTCFSLCVWGVRGGEAINANSKGDHY